MLVDVRYSLLKFTFRLEIGEISHIFLSACNFTDTRRRARAHECLGALSRK